tara:strand:+ start:9633 stop:12347 length:2715 start_codon:yes stop_codon:yes gene_type:complete
MISKGEKKLFLIDAYALIYRAFFAFSKNPRITSKGFDTSAIYGFTNTLIDLINSEKPQYLGVVFDTPKKTHRHIEYVEYKANRDSMPEGISSAIPYIKKILNAFNIPILLLDGFEADDVIGTLAKQAEKQNFQTYMLTPDKDFAQLVSKSTFMYRPSNRGNPSEIWDVNQVCERFNIDNVEQVIDFLGMVGDAVDNIPGIAGVGPKTASKLLKIYGSIEEMYSRINEFNEGKLKEKILTSKDKAFLSKKLATIITNAPINLNSDDLQFSDPNIVELNEIFNELEFKRVLERLSLIVKKSDLVKNNSKNNGQLDMFSVDTKLKNSIIQYGNQITSISSLSNCLKKIKLNQPIAFFQLYNKHNILIGLSFSQSYNQSHYIIFNDELNFDDLIKMFRPIFSSEDSEKIFWQSKDFLFLLKKHQLSLNGKFFDITIADYLLNPDSNRTLSGLLQKYDIETINIDLLDLTLKEDISSYLIESSRVLIKLKDILLALIEDGSLIKLFYDVELPLVNVLLNMEFHGIHLDVQSLIEYSKKLTSKINNLEKSIFLHANERFNIASPKQLGDILFLKMKLVAKPKKTKSGQFSTSESELRKIRDKHKIIDDILLFRTYQKLLSTYVNALPLLIDKYDNKIHTTFNQTITNTGRLSSSSPNLQNIPIRKSSGKEVRRAFIPSKGHILMAADYSQIELRLIAELSKEKTMIESFLNNEDIHITTASKVFKIDLDKVTSDMRLSAKTVNFGIIYGVSAFGLSEQSALNRKEAADLINMYFSTYPRLKLFIDNQIDFARTNGFVKTILGRKRYLRNINSRNSFIRSHDERNAVNMPIQGSAADLIKLAMINIDREFDKLKLKSKMVLQVHDELVFDVPLEEKDIVKKLVKKNMESVYNTTVPLKVEIGFGTNWLDAH